jgi:hypothetical protein
VLTGDDSSPVSPDHPRLSPSHLFNAIRCGISESWTSLFGLLISRIGAGERLEHGALTKDSDMRANTRRANSFSCFVSVFLLAAIVTATAAGREGGRDKQKAAPGPSISRSNQRPFPAVAIDLMMASRLNDKAYFQLVAGDGLLDVAPRLLFTRMSAAAAAGDTYKALYLARVFTEVAPALPDGWRNRAQLAGALGLTREAAASNRRANDPSGNEPVPLDLLPGQPLTVKPASIADWAGAVLLMSDAARVARISSLPVVRDDVSGLRSTTEQELRSNPDRGAWARAEPIRLDHVVPNVLLLRSGQPMKFKSENSGSFWAGMGLAMLAGAAQAKNAGASATTLAEASGSMMARADAVKSHYVGGKFEAVSFPAGTAKTTVQQPRSTGEHDAVGIPVPVLWAAGGSMAATTRVNLRSTMPEWVMRVGDAAGNFKKKIENLHVPKMAALGWTTEGAGINERPRFGQSPVLIKELLFTPEDLDILSSRVMGHPLRQLSLIDAQYKLGRLMLLPHNLILRNDGGLSGRTIGWDDAGRVYYFSPNKTAWLFTAGK